MANPRHDAGLKCIIQRMVFRSPNDNSSAPEPAYYLPDRENSISPGPLHFVSRRPIVNPGLENLQVAVFGLGCFWGAERKFWELPGVFSTAVGYAGGVTANPGYDDVCSGKTGHAEVVLVYFDPDEVQYSELLHTFWEAHDPTQGMRQGNDRGTQYRSAIYTNNAEQSSLAEQSRNQYQACLHEAGRGNITTEIKPLERFFYAEDYHQQYLAKNPQGYCGLGGTGIAFAEKR